MTATAAFGLTRKQRDVLLVIQELTALDGVPPTYAEIAREIDAPSRSEIKRLLNLLRDRGWIDWLPYRHRSIVVLRQIPMPEEPEIVGLFDMPAAAVTA
jgi:SOS-response transcriptional repressor LexA